MRDFTKTQKVIKVGNSYAVTLDSKFVDENQVKAGDQVVGSYSKSHVAYAVPKNQSMTLKDSASLEYGKKLSKAEKRAVMHSKVTPELSSWTDDFLKKNKQAMEELANL